MSPKKNEEVKIFLMAVLTFLLKGKIFSKVSAFMIASQKK